jgi:hypothetical protein
MKPLPSAVKRNFETSGPDCPLLDREIETLDDFLETTRVGGQWYRGHANFRWDLKPSALRYKRRVHRERALDLFRQFRQFATADMGPAQSAAAQIEWMVRAQHYGIPTRLLDWTEHASAALYFACLNHDVDGAVLVMNPATLNLKHSPLHPRPVRPEDSPTIVEPYAALGPSIRRGGLCTIAICPDWTNSRIKAQRGSFTLHGEAKFLLDSKQCPSMLYIPIRKKHKKRLLRSLDQVGINEMAVYPELERIARYIRQRANLP